jgi:ribosomal protein S18 acetylase RimI-like enzyme
LELIKDIDSYNYLLDKYTLKDTLTNNYLMAEQVSVLIENKNLTFIEGVRNLYFFVEHLNAIQIYCHLNDLVEQIELPIHLSFTMEIVYRGQLKRPLEALDFWNKNNFKTHLTRDNYSLVYKSKTEGVKTNSRINLSLAQTEEESGYIHQLFSKDLDKYTGDQKSFVEIKKYVSSGLILVARVENQLCGALQFEWKSNNCWLGHIVVDGQFRGQGIANALVDYYIETNKKTDQTRYQLWVIDDNLPAVNLYKRFGFIYAGKSTVSMLKLKEL